MWSDSYKIPIILPMYLSYHSDEEDKIIVDRTNVTFTRVIYILCCPLCQLWLSQEYESISLSSRVLSFINYHKLFHGHKNKCWLYNFATQYHLSNYESLEISVINISLIYKYIPLVER